MKHLTSTRLIVGGIILMILGIILPFLMVLQILESTLLMNFIAYLASFGGLIIGLMGVVEIARTRRRDEDET
jgi:hypothetical protein